MGLIRFTNIKNIFQFCKLTKTPQTNKNTLFKFIPLHSKYPQLVRKNIEHNLSIALNRKLGDGQLAEFLRNYGILEEARATGAFNIQVIVLSSPVIETGNDLDFDWGIIDPNGEGVSRVIIQSGGRINRHRAKNVIHPNVGILSSALRTKIESNGRLENPGIESHVKKESGHYKLEKVFKCDLNGQNSIQDLFGFEVGSDEFKYIDKQLTIGDQHQHNRINSLEEEKLLDFLFHKDTHIFNYIRNQATQFSTLFPQLRQFRYSSTPQTQIYWNPFKDKFCLISDDTETSIKSTEETTQLELLKELYEFGNYEVPADKFKSVYYMNYEDYGRDSIWRADRFLGLYNEKWLE
jgi:CRISPR-associated endonuclease/helicase Cas3